MNPNTGNFGKLVDVLWKGKEVYNEMVAINMSYCKMDCKVSWLMSFIELDVSYCIILDITETFYFLKV